MIASLKNSLKQIPTIVAWWNIYKDVIGFFSPKNIYYRINNWLHGGLPLPAPRMMRLVAGTDNVEWFLTSGKQGATSMLAILQKNHLNMENFSHVLDFGCGVGRVIRYWAEVKGPKYSGTDYNPILINWSKGNLKFASFQVNPLVGCLDHKTNPNGPAMIFYTERKNS